MSYLYVTRTIHCPVVAVGSRIENSFGVTIATCIDDFQATAMATLINAGHPVVQEQEHEHDREERDFAARMFAARLRG